MLSLFRRRKGRHQLGAAVTSIPSVLPSVAPAVPAPVQARTPQAVPAAAPVAVSVPDPVPPPAVVPVAAVVAVPTPGPRVELGFRDGSRASLDPSSEQARALEGIAAVLTRKD